MNVLSLTKFTDKRMVSNMARMVSIMARTKMMVSSMARTKQV